MERINTMKFFENIYKGDKKDLIKLFIQFIKFGLVGISNTLISLFIYYLCIFCGVNYIMSNTLAFIISVINAYYWNNRYVFKNDIDMMKRSVIKSFIKVFSSYSFTFVLGTVLLILWVHILHISELIAPLINLCITIPLNFLLNKFWAFR